MSETKTRTEKAGSLWAELGPAIAFILTYSILGRFPEGEGLFTKDTAIYWATGALMAATAAVVVTKLSRREKVPPMLILSASVVGFFGVLTIALQSPTFAYIKPTIINLLFSVVILGGLVAGRNLWKLMLQHVFDLPDFAWDTLAFRWGLFFAFMALLNEFLWRTFCPVPESPMTLLGLTIAPAEPYTVLGWQFGARDQEEVWAWMKIANIFISAAFMLANAPYTFKHWRRDSEETEGASA